MKNIDVIVYVPAYNAEKYIGKCLKGILDQTYPVREIVVIDDGSTDRTVEIARDLKCRVIQREKNMGLSQARKLAFETLDADYLAALDADCVPTPEWLEVLVGDLIGGSIVGSSGKLIEYYTENAVDRWRSVHMKQHWGSDRCVSPLSVFGSNTIYLRKAVLEVGNYPTSEFYHTNNEDYYIARKLYERGYKVIYNPAAIVYHHRQDSIYSLFRTYWRWFFLHRPRPDSLKGLFEKLKTNVSFSFDFMKEDIKRRDIKLLFLSFLFQFYQEAEDVTYYLSSNFDQPYI